MLRDALIGGLIGSVGTMLLIHLFKWILGR